MTIPVCSIWMPNSSQVLLLFLDRGHSAIETSDSHRKPSVPMLFGQDKLTQKLHPPPGPLPIWRHRKRRETREEGDRMWRRKTVHVAPEDSGYVAL
jgi:hypothetical protein